MNKVLSDLTLHRGLREILYKFNNFLSYVDNIHNHLLLGTYLLCLNPIFIMNN